MDRWQRSSLACEGENALPEFVLNLLTPVVTASLPPAWQGEYSLARARTWIEDRNRESTNLLAVRRDTGQAAGLVILNEEDWPNVHVGFLFLESEWGGGLASEFVQGLVTWCQRSGVRTISGGTAIDNLASQRVLEKNGFTAATSMRDDTELHYKLSL